MSKYTLRPYVSVIITIFNNTQYIDQCIKSVLYQALKNIEIICIVDDSTDNAFEKISLYQKNDKRIHILRQKNQYVGAARNSGLIHASGKYVYFLDSDDFIEPTCLEKLYVKAEETNADIVLFDGSLYDENSKTYVKHCFLNINNISKNIFNVYDYPDFIFNCIKPALGVKLYKTSFLKEKCALFQKYETIGDLYVTSITQVLAKSISFIDEDLFVHRNDSLTSAENIDIKYYIYELIDIYNQLKSLNIYNIVEKSYISRCIYTILCAINFVDCKKRIAFIKNLYDLLFSKINIMNLDEKYYIDINSYYKLKEFLNQYNFYKKHIDFSVEQKLIHKNNVDYPLVSVVIPVFNVADYVGKCIESIINQTLKNIEIICINDGSSDNSLDIITKYASIDNRIAIYSENNCGQSIARNLGMEVAKGKYIYFIDSDDLLDKNTLFELFKKCENEKLDLVFFGAEAFTDDMLFNGFVEKNKQNYIKKGKYDRVYSGIDIFKLMSSNGDFTSSSCMIFAKTNFYRNNNIKFINTILHEDEAFTFEACLLAKRVCCVNELYYKRRYRYGSTMTVKKSFENVYGYFRCYLSMVDFIISKNIEICETIVSHINNVLNNAIYIYNNNIEFVEKHNYLVFHSYEYIKFYFHILKYCNIINEKNNEINNFNCQLSNANNIISNINDQLSNMKNSFSFKIGRIITYIPRMVRKYIYKIIK